MKLLKPFISVSLLLASFSIIAGGMPPKYMAVEDYDKCVKSYATDNGRAVCIPLKKPKACPKDSWKELKGLGELDEC